MNHAWLSSVQTVMIVDDSFDYQARLNTNYHALSSTIIDYHQLSYSLDIFKFDIIFDDSFCHLNERMILNDIFRSTALPKTSSNRNGKWKNSLQSRRNLG